MNRIASVFLIVLLFCPPLKAQETTPPAFGEIIDVRVVNLEAVVEDRDGNRVTGLPPDAFRLRINGEETPIEFFTEIADGLAAETSSANGRVAPGETVGTSYLLFIDEYFTIKRDRNRVLEGVAEELSRLGRKDRMAIVAYDGRRLDMVSNWNQSPADLQRSIEVAMERPSRGMMTRTLLREAHTGQSRINEVERRLDNVVMAVTSTLRSFGNPPGRKVMLLMSGGWPHSPARWALESEFVFDFGRGDRALAPIYQTANLLGYTLYPIDAPGIEQQGADASQPGRPARSDTRELEVQQTLRILAQTTGGQPLLNNRRLASLDTVIEDTRTYYWLGFTPYWQGNNQTHEVELEVLRPGLKVRHRGGFEDMSRQKEVDFIVEGALLFRQLPGRADLKVEMSEPRRDGRRLMVPLKVHVPLDQVTVMPHQGRYIVRLELRLAARDERGDRSELDVIPIVLQSASPATPGQVGIQEVTARMRKKKQDLIVSLHDPLGGNILVSVLSFDPSANQQAQDVL